MRMALKPGGRLILLEVIDPNDVATNFWTGLVPGWWVAHEEWRPYSAAVPEKQWDTCLRATGFSGNELIIRDYQSDKCHFMSIIMSTALGPDPSEQPAKGITPALTEPRLQAAASGGKPQPDLIMIVDDEGKQKDLVSKLLGRLNAGRDRQVAVAHCLA